MKLNSNNQSTSLQTKCKRGLHECLHPEVNLLLAIPSLVRRNIILIDECHCQYPQNRLRNPWKKKNITHKSGTDYFKITTWE